MGETLSLSDIKDLQAAADPSTSVSTAADTAGAATDETTGAASEVQPQSAAGDVVTPMSVASGYTLWNPGTRRTDYIYDSNLRGANEAECNDAGCTVINRWETQLHQYVVGNTSKQWQLTLNAIRDIGTENPTFSYVYHCAVNVSGSSDHYCSTGLGADPSGQSAAMSAGTTLYRYFEYGATNKEYPMIDIQVHFLHVTVGTKFRGYDVCVKSSKGTKLCTSSGTGA